MPIEEKVMSCAAPLESYAQVKATDDVARTYEDAWRYEPLADVNRMGRAPGTIGISLKIGASQHPKYFELRQGG